MPRVPVRDNSWLPSVCLNSFISLIRACRPLYGKLIQSMSSGSAFAPNKADTGGRGRPPETARGNEMVPKNMQKNE